MLSRNIKKLLILAIMVSIVGCADEDPSLVYQKPQTETIRLRLLNLAGDSEARTLILNGTTSTASGAYKTLTPAIKPPADSATVEIYLNGSKEYQLTNRVTFVRNTNYTFVTLPSQAGAAQNRPVDRVAVINSLFGMIEKPNNAYIKMLNAVPDTTVTYQLNFGCQSGPALVSALSYGYVSAQSDIKTGVVPVTISKTKLNGAPEFVGLYNITLNQNGQYTLIVTNNGVYLLDDLNTDVQAITKLDPVPESNMVTKVRAVNFSSGVINVKKTTDNNNEDITQGSLIPNMLSSYSSLGACQSATKDIISSLDESGNVISADSVSLEVGEKISVLVFDDTLGKKSGLTLTTRPIHLNEPYNGRALVRVVNGANKTNTGITLSMGARDASNPAGFQTGEVLATSLLFGNISEPLYVAPGRAPLTLYTNTNPGRLLLSTEAVLEANKSYLIVFSNTTDGDTRLSITEDPATADNGNVNINFLPKEASFAITNLVYGTPSVIISIPGILIGAKVNNSSSISTVLPTSEQNITINGKQITVNYDSLLIVAAGSSENTNIFKFKKFSSPVSGNNLNIRYINAVPGTKIRVYLDNVGNNKQADGLDYGTISGETQLTQEKEQSFVFTDMNDNVLYRVNDIAFTFWKNYYVIFGKNAGGNGYSVVVQQEF